MRKYIELAIAIVAVSLTLYIAAIYYNHSETKTVQRIESNGFSVIYYSSDGYTLAVPENRMRLHTISVGDEVSGVWIKDE